MNITPSLHASELVPGSFIFYSASQLQTFKACQRKWWWEKIGGFKPPTSQSQLVGTGIHSVLEDYRNTGTRPQDLRALDATRFIPVPKPATEDEEPTVFAERKFEIPLHLPNRKFTGFIDHTDISDPNLPKVLDFKTLSDVDKYSKTDYQLAADLQLNVYAFETLRTLAPHAEEIEVAHLYIQTRKTIKSKLVSAKITKEHVTTNWNNYLKIIDNMETVRTCSSAEDVEPNWNACGDYGGCYHRARCDALMFEDFQIPSEKPVDTPWGTNLDVPASPADLESLKMLLAPDTTRRPEGAPPAIPETVAPEALPKELRGMFNAPKDEPVRPVKGLSKMDFSKIETNVTQIETSPANRTMAFMAKLAGGATPVAPPDDIIDETPAQPEPQTLPEVAQAPASPFAFPAPAPGFVWALTDHGQPYQRRADMPPAPSPAPQAAPTALHAVPPPPMPLPVAPPPVAQPVQAQPPVPQAPPPQAQAPAAPQEQKKGPGRPKKENGAVPGASAHALVQPVKQASAPQESGLHFLMIDCQPVSGFGEFVTFEKWVAPIVERVRLESGLDWQFHEYRKGPGFLNAVARQTPLPPAMLVSSRLPEAGVLMAFLIEKAGVVIKGVG